MPLGKKVDLGLGDSVLDGNLSPRPPEKGTAHPPFQPMSIVAKRSPTSATAEHLFSTVPRDWLGRMSSVEWLIKP